MDVAVIHVLKDGTQMTPLSTAEQTALNNFVLGGGGAVLVAETSDEGWSAVDSSVLGPFGASSNWGTNASVTGTITNTTHAVTSGPFGTVTSFWYNKYGHLRLGSTGTMLGTAPGITSPYGAIGANDPGTLGVGSGGVVYFTDTSPLTSPGGASGSNGMLLLNSLAFATRGPKSVYSLTLINGDMVQAKDFANYQYPLVGDRVWNDLNGNGVQDAGEPSLTGAGVELFRAGSDGQIGGGDDVSKGTVTTDAFGTVPFQQCAAGRLLPQVHAA